MPDDAVAQLAIADLVARYCDAVARADAAAFAACWAPDARWTGPGLDRTGAEVITRAWEKMRARVTLAIPAILSGSVHVDGLAATGTWWIRETLQQTDGVVRETVGRYDDAYVYGADGWQFAGRAFTPVPAAT
jgi:ketosteroid isomerase-like protein